MLWLCAGEYTGRKRSRDFIRYAQARQKKRVYEFYIAEGIRYITENTAKQVGGMALSKSYEEIIHPRPVDARSAEEIADDFIKRAGLVVTE